MYKLYKDGESLILPDGKSYTSAELKSMPGYSMLFSLPCALEINGGVTVSYQPVSSIASKYGVPEEDNPEDTVLNVNAIIEKSRRNNVRSFSVNKAAQILALSFTDEQAIEVADLYPEYEVDHAYKQNDRFQYNGSLYKVNQDHTSAAQWVPGETGTESLYTNLMLDESGYQIWKQPTGAHDAYNTGDIVRYPDKDGQLYKSTIDGNVWAPDAYPQGWEVYTEE